MGKFGPYVARPPASANPEIPVIAGIRLLRVSAAICLGAAIAAAVLVRKYRHADSGQPVEVGA